ncbi:MAG TPA: hypothetical protein PKE49_03795 [Leptospiraceae bacterium]|jgi:hypothetical protein|nr:hypothetical protein [Leptospirales bacterium]HMU84190.1 hypothetical protein [Leptospiraceae bacterium]HMW61753.1 hypothetical protein [Leptospiraceae bacterium]HMX55617.1 hypothetical protein [Leptospiraceae bacterium]HMY45464.1 hypothetical protein [Leptospiraceae bacterium]
MKVIAFAVLLLLSGCIVENDTVDTADAYSEIYASIQFKARQCGNQPAYPLLVPENPPSYGTRLCSLSIIRQDCPFTNYPLFCVEMFGIDLPGIGP